MQVADGQDTPSQRRESLPPAPHQGGPLGSSGAASPAPDPATPAGREGRATPADPKAAAGDGKAGDQAAPAEVKTGDQTALAEGGATPADPKVTAGDGKAGDQAVPAEVKTGDQTALAEGGATPADPKAAAGDGKAGDQAVPAAVKTGDQTAPAEGNAGARVVRTVGHVRPQQAARAARRTTVEWSRRPSGRLILPAVLATLMIAAAGTAGAYLVPAALRAMPAPTATPSFAPGAPALPTAVGTPPAFPTDTFSPVSPTLSAAPGQVAAGGRPADALAGWAQQVGTRVGIPVVAVQAYGYAELVLNRTTPACRLSWTTLAAIAKVESAHGSANGAVLGADGQALPAIVGLPLDGKGGRQLIADTDGGAMDSDRTFDRAMGPLQFIPTTWRENAVDADNNGVTDPNDIDDASLAAGNYLCRNGRDMTKPEDWWEAILSYNDVRPYAQKVFAEANAYGQRSRT